MALVLGTFLSGGSTHAAESAKANLPVPTRVCTPTAASDAVFAARSRLIRFKDGREITVIGLNHGNRDLRGGTADRISRVQTTDDLQKLVMSDPAAANDARAAVRFLSENSHKFRFIAAEASPTTVSANLKTYGTIRKRLLSLKAAAANDAMMLAFGPDFYFQLSQPTGLKLIGVEDAALGDTYLKSLPAMEKATRVLSASKFEPDSAARLSEFLNSLAARYVSFRPESDDFIREARARFTAQDFARIEPFLRARLDVMRAMKARDRHDVERLLAENASGVLLIGSSHLDSVASLLQDACLAIGAK